MKVLNFLIKTHLHLALAHGFLIHCVLLFFFEEYVWPLTLFLFGITGFVYALNSLKDKEEDAINTPEKSELFQKYGKLIVSIYLSISLISIVSFWSSPKVLIAIAAVFMIGFFYSIPLLPLYSKGSWKLYKFKEILFFKNFITALTAVVYSIFLPFIYFEVFPNLPAWMIGATFFSVNLVSTIMCDVRDIEGDRAANIKTIATQFGRKRTTNLCYVIILIPLVVSLILSLAGLFSLKYLIIIFLINIAQLSFLIYQDFRKLNQDFYGLASESFIYVGALSFLIF